MALPSIGFRNPYDLHLLRGQSINFGALISVGSSSLTNYQATNSNASISFKILANGASSADGSYIGSTFNGPGFTFDENTQVLQLSTSVPTEEIHSFVFIVEGIDLNDATPEIMQTNKKVAATRVHIHSGIDEAWLSPSPLSAYVDVRCRPSIYLKYNDGVVARLLQEHFNPLITPQLSVTWSSPGVSGLIDPLLNRDIKATTTGEFNIEAQITEASLGVDVTATGQVSVSRRLSSNSPLQASLVTTGNCPGFTRIDHVANVLFIPDGFLEADEVKFHQMVDDYVQFLMTSNSVAPFQLLAGSINFWKVFIPSRESGGTLIKELVAYNRDGRLYGIAYSATKPQNFDTTNWNTQNLTYHFGPAVYRFSTTPNEHNSNAPLTIAQVREYWKATSTLTDAQIDAIRTSEIESWRLTAHRVLPEETDTALGVRNPEGVSLTPNLDDDLISLTSSRVSRHELNDMFRTLEDDQGNIIGDRFSSRSVNTGRTDDEGNAIHMVPKDFDNIAIITALDRGRANNSDGYFFTKINPHSGPLLLQSHGSKVKISAPTNAQVLNLRSKAVMTHELCHSFGLGDEYAEDAPESFNNKFTDDSTVSDYRFLNYKSDPKNLDGYANLQSRPDLLINDPDTPGSFRLHGAKLKWRLHRIVKCGVVAEVPTQSGNRIILTLKTGHSQSFENEDVVYLRKRRSNKISIFIESEMEGIVPDIQDHDWQPIHGYTNTRPPNPVGNPSEYNLVPTRSDRMVIKAVNTASDRLEIETAPGTAVLHDYFFTLEPWEEVIIYNPMEVPGGDSSPGYPFAELISRPVLAFLNDSPFPLNAKSDSSAGGRLKEIIDNSNVQASRIPSRLVPSCSRRKKQIVAMYSNGARYHGSIYHPTGQCLMRTTRKEDSIEGLCEVCKYTLVNIIDPSKHPQLNEKYSSKIYPS